MKLATEIDLLRDTAMKKLLFVIASLGVLAATIPIDRRMSIYALAGDWLPVTCAIGCVGMIGVTWLRRRSHR